MKAKRTLDLIVAIPMLIVLFPLFGIVVIIIRLTSKGPIFFRQVRAGKDGKAFKIFKFRTMVDGAEKIGRGYEMTKDDSRITAIGRRLRDWGIDELPQLINVINGDASLVGPRAARMEQHDMFTDVERRRVNMPPGITGLAIIKGRNTLDWKQRIQLDLWYIDNWSLWMDVRILFQTLYVVLIARRGIYGPGGLNRDYNSSTGTLVEVAGRDDIEGSKSNV